MFGVVRLTCEALATSRMIAITTFTNPLTFSLTNIIAMITNQALPFTLINLQTVLNNKGL